MVGHVGFADPFDEKIAKVVRECGHALAGDGVVLHDKGTVVCMGSSPLAIPLSLPTYLTSMQRDPNSPHAPSQISTVPGAAPLLTCLRFPKPNSLEKQRWSIK